MSIAAATNSFLQSGLAAALICVICGLLVGLAVMLVLHKRSDVGRLVGGYVSPPSSREAQTRSLIERALGDKEARTIARSPFWTRLGVELEVAKVKLKPDQILLLVVAVTALLGWVLVVSTGSILAAPLALFVPVLGHAGLRMAADRQRRTFGDQLPDNLQVIASAMRAGQTFVGALAAVVEDAPEPSNRELKRAVTDEGLGIPLGDALGQVTERMKSSDFNHVAVVASLQRETGGNTAEVIDLVSETVRERIEIRRMVRGLTAQGRLAGLILSMLPVGLLLLISVINPAYVHPLFHTTGGQIALVVAVVLTVAGSLLIRRIVNIKI